MRVFIVACVLVLGTAASVAADQWPVVVTTETGAQIRGRLLSITDDRLTLSRDGKLEPIPMSTVLTVVKPRDSVLDGFLKGIVIGAVPLLLWGSDVDARFATRFVLTYGVVGLGVDALHYDSFTVYDRAARDVVHPRAAALGWKLRF